MSKDLLKIRNTDQFLNSVSLKSRYNLIESNRQNAKNGVEIGSHWHLNMPYPLVDNDLKESKIKLFDKPIKELNSRNREIFNSIAQIDILSKLNNLNHTKELRDTIKKIKAQSTLDSNLFTEDKEEQKYKTMIFKDIEKRKRYSNFNDENKNNINKKHCNSHDNRNIKKKKKIIYDIRPINMIKEKNKTIILPKIESNVCKTDRNETADNKEDNEVEVEYEYSSGQKIVTELTKAKPNFKKQFTMKNKTRKPHQKGENEMITLQFLADELIDSKKNEEQKEISKEDKNNHNKRVLFIENIIIKDGDKDRNQREKNHKIKKNKSGVDEEYFIFDKKEKEKPFPKKMYNLNFRFENNEKNITDANDVMSDIEKKMNFNYDEAKKYVHRCFEDEGVH